MSTWFECRLFDLGRFESLRHDLEALIRGEARPSVRAAALDGLDQLTRSPAYGSDEMREERAAPLQAIANAAGHFPDRKAVPSVNPLLEAVCMAGYERLSFDPAAPRPRNLVVLAGGDDGNLYAELATRSPWIQDLFNGNVIPWWPQDLPNPEPPDYEQCQHRPVLVLNRADLERLDSELARVAADPRWLKDLSWDRVIPAYAAPAFARLRDLVARARAEPHLTVAVEVNG